MKNILFTAIALTMNCSGIPLESKIEGSSKINKEDILQIDADYENKFPEVGGNVTYALCKVGQHVAVIIQDGGSGLYVCSMRIYVKAEKEWICVKSSRISTGDAQATPEKVTLNHNIVTIFSKEGKIIDSVDVSRYL